MALTQIDDRGLKTPIDLLDNEKIRLGTGNDLELYHNGSNSIIDSNTGNLEITTDSFYVNNAANNEVQIKAVADGAVELYYNNNKKLETTSGGATLSGALTVNSGDIDIATDGHKIKIGAGDDLQLYHDSNENIIGSATTGLDIFFKSSASSSLDTTSFVVRSDGSITHPDNIKSKWGTGDDLQIYHNGSNSYINNATGALAITGNDLNFENAARDETYIECDNGGAVKLYYDNSKKFETYASGTKIYGHIDQPTANSYIYGSGHNVVQTDSTRTYFYGGTDGVQIRNADNSAELVTMDNSGNTRMYGRVGIGQAASGYHPLAITHNQQYIVGIKNTAAHNSYFPWLMHKAITAGQAFGIHFNGIAGDKFHVDQNGAIYLGSETAAANALDDYEEGTWTPTDGSGASLSLTNNYTATYTKIGRFVHLNFDVSYPSTSNSSDAQLGGIPFNLGIRYGTGVVGWTNYDNNGVYCHIGTDNTIYLMDNTSSSSSGTQHLDNSEASGKRFIGNATYYVS